MKEQYLPKRKHLRIKGYDYSTCGAYFITISTYDHICLFGDVIKDDTVGVTLHGHPYCPDIMIYKWLFELENKFEGVYVDSYIIMPNHIHFIMFLTNNQSISSLLDIVGWFKTMTTNEYIRNVKKGIFPPFKKSIWQRGYFEHIIRNDDDLYETRKYISNNLLKWYYEHNT